MDGIDPCAVLGVPASATAEDIKRAYRTRLLATHPDRGGRRDEAEAVIAAFRQLQRRRPNPFAPRTVPPPTTVLYDHPRPKLARRASHSDGYRTNFGVGGRSSPTFAAVLAEVQGSQR